MEQIVIYLVMVQKFKTKDSETVATQSYLGNILKDWIVDNLRRLD